MMLPNGTLVRIGMQHVVLTVAVDDENDGLLARHIPAVEWARTRRGTLCSLLSTLHRRFLTAWKEIYQQEGLAKLYKKLFENQVQTLQVEDKVDQITFVAGYIVILLDATLCQQMDTRMLYPFTVEGTRLWCWERIRTNTTRRNTCIFPKRRSVVNPVLFIIGNDLLIPPITCCLLCLYNSTVRCEPFSATRQVQKHHTSPHKGGENLLSSSIVLISDGNTWTENTRHSADRLGEDSGNAIPCCCILLALTAML